MCKTDCGRCIDCIETDDYAPTWRNPRFQAATSADAPLALEDEMAKRRIVERIFEWPTDPTFDERALEHSGIEDPYAIGLILPDDDDLKEMVRNVA